MILISVVIPTHNRANTLNRTLDALSTQTLGAGSFEVIVVADACTDETMDLLHAYQASFRLIVHQLRAGRGAAAARNAGAALAASDIVLFLDDDMEASPGLLAEHLECHGRFPGRVILGHFPMPPPAKAEDPFTKSSRLWWAEGFAARKSPGYRFSLKDFCTGNISMPLPLFRELGGFDEQIDARAAGEDYELGYRMISKGIRFHYAPEAVSIHHTRTPLSMTLLRAEQEGHGQSLLVLRHPELFGQFNVSQLSVIAHRPGLRPVWRALWRWPALAGVPAAMLLFLVRFLAARRMYSLLWRFYRPLRGYYYWRGVHRVFGTLSTWERLAQDASHELPDLVEIDFDIARDLPRLDDLLQEAKVHAVRVWLRGEPIGRIPAIAGYEAFTGPQLLQVLIRHFPGFLFNVMVTELSARQNQPVLAGNELDSGTSAANLSHTAP